MKRSAVKSLLCPVVLIPVLFIFLALPSDLNARQPTPIEGRSFNVFSNMKDTLNSLIGKKVSLSLRSGAVYGGLVKAVGDHFLHLEKIQSKEFYDAFIRIEDISAIELQFLELK